MNILFCYYNGFDPSRGGVQKVTFDLAEFLSCNGFNVFYLSGKHADNSSLKSLKNQFFLPKNELFTELNKQFYDNLLISNDIKIVVNHDASNYRSNFFLDVVKRDQIKLVSFFHSDPLVRLSNSIIFQTKKKFRFISPIVILIKKYRTKKEISYLINNSDLVIVLSPAIKRNIQSVLGLPVQKVSAQYNFIKLFKTDSELEKIEKRLKRVVCVGRIDLKNKRHDLLLKIWQKIELVNDSHELIIIGGGDDEIKVRDLANSLGLKRVKFTGFADPKPYYQTAEVSVLTSDYEGFSMVMVESLFYGAIPILFNNWAAVEDFVINGVNGVVIEPGNLIQFENSLLQLLNDNSYQEKLRQNNLITLSKLDPLEIGNSWLNLLNNLFSKQ